MERYQQLLKNCVEQSQNLLEYAKSEEWERLESAMHLRDQELQLLINTEFSAEQTAEVRQAIAVIQATDQQLRKLVEKNKDVIFKSLKKSDTGKKMRAAYGNTQRPY